MSLAATSCAFLYSLTRLNKSITGTLTRYSKKMEEKWEKREKVEKTGKIGENREKVEKNGKNREKMRRNEKK